MAKAAMTVIRGGACSISTPRSTEGDILVKGDTIVEIGRPGLSAPEAATVIDARDRLLHPA
jgi:5-methylthioadenosine/S-adenosylhomocysteine deaminase